MAMGPGAAQARTKVSEVISSASARLPDRYIANRKTSGAYLAYSALKSVMANRRCSSEEAAGDIGPGMGDHAGAQALSPQSQESEQRSIDRNGETASYALIAMSNAKHRHLEEQGQPRAAGERGQLPLQIATEDEFFRDTGADGQQHPERRFGKAMRHQRREGRRVAGARPTVPEGAHAQPQDPGGKREDYIHEDRPDAVPSAPDELGQG